MRTQKEADVAKSPRCPTCNQPLGDDPQARPFCTERCKLLDLGKWLGEEFRVASVEDPYDPGEEMEEIEEIH